VKFLTELFEVMRDGAWLTRARIMRWAAVTLACAVGFELFIAGTAHGLNDYDGRPFGTDFSSFYAAGRVALHGANPYDQDSLYQIQRSVFGSGTPYYSFAYPPFFVIVTELLVKLPYFAAFALWQGSSFAFYLSGMAALRRRFGTALPGDLYFISAAAFTAVIVNLTHGQTAFLTAGFFAFGLALLPESPWLAGAALGLLAIKPQFGLLIPIALAAGGHWRSFGAAAVTIFSMVVATTVVLGTGIWGAFLESANQSRHIILDLGGVGYPKMVTVFAWARLWRFPLALAYAAQAVVSLSGMFLVSLVWRSGADWRLKGAALCAGTLLVTPFALDYDLMILAPAIALLAMYGFDNAPRPYLAAILSVLWLSPLFVRFFASALAVPLGSWCVIGVLFLVWAEASAEVRSPPAKVTLA
jgi:alpha-1,2-mannosyltransferase